MVSVVIDQDACIACGVCSALCSEVFEKDENGISQITEEYREEEVYKGEIPEDIECVKEAVDSCPVDAISID